MDKGISRVEHTKAGGDGSGGVVNGIIFAVGKFAMNDLLDDCKPPHCIAGTAVSLQQTILIIVNQYRYEIIIVFLKYTIK